MAVKRIEQKRLLSGTTANANNGTSRPVLNQWDYSKNKSNANNTSLGGATNTSSASSNYSSQANAYRNQANAVNLNINRNDYKPDLSAMNNYNNIANNFMNIAAQSVSNNNVRGTVGPNRYQNRYEEAYNALSNRDKFSYNQKDDPLYQQYEDMYTRNARMAMQDTVGQISALTGGYGSSYAETAGQSMYNQAMAGLNDKALQLYDSALNAYNSETNRLATNFDAISNMYGTEQSNLQYNADLLESQYQYDQSMAQADRNMYYGLAQNYANMGEGARQFGLNMAESQYNTDISNALNKANMYYGLASDYDKLFENARQYDSSNELDREKFNWQKSTDDRDYNRSVFESDRAYNYQTERDKVSDKQFADNLKYNYLNNGFDYDPVTGKATRSEWYNNERAEDQAYRWASAGLSYDPTTGKVTRNSIAQQDYDADQAYRWASAGLSYNPETGKVTQSDIAKQAETKQAALDQIKALSAAGDYTGASQVIYNMEESGAFSRGEAEAYMDTYGLSSQASTKKNAPQETYGTRTVVNMINSSHISEEEWNRYFNSAGGSKGGISYGGSKQFKKNEYNDYTKYVIESCINDYEKKYGKLSDAEEDYIVDHYREELGLYK